MRNSIHRYFRIGTIQQVSYPGVSVLKALEKLGADDFLDAVEVCQIHDDEERAKAKQVLAQFGLKVYYGAQPRLFEPGSNPNAADEGERKKTEQTLLETVGEAEYLGVGEVIFLAGKWDKGTKEGVYQQLLRATQAVCSYAAEKNMNMELEVFGYSVDKIALMGPAPLAARLAADMWLSHSSFGLLVDLSHFPTTCEDGRFVIRCLRPCLTHFHIRSAVMKQEAEGYGDQYPRLGSPEDVNDAGKLKDFFQVLREEGFFDPAHPYVLSFEVEPRKDEEPDLVVANTKCYIHRA